MMRNRVLAAAWLAGVAFAAAACGSSSAGTAGSPSTSAAASPSAGMNASGATVKTATISGVTVLTNANGFTLYSFAPDTPARSNCNGTCTAYWPPVPGPVTATAGLTGRLGTIKRSDGSAQAAYNGHPLYTYIGDASPGQAKGNGLNLSGGVWHEVTASGAAAPAGSGSPSSSPGSGYGY
jgi:predicted lipoprotein with Yx(FWY)xxD motif